jgi:glucosamine--fructose-6-phosphate aminotransferase (isomerizing)
VTGARGATAGRVMAAEMAEQPSVLARLAARRADLADRVRGVLPEAPVGIVLIARGSSDHAAIYGRYVLGLASGLPVALAAPSLQTLYDGPLRCPGYLAIAISQSGRTPEIVTVLERYVEAGAIGVAISNMGDTLLAEVASAAIELEAGEERAVPATKTFTASVTALAIVAEAFGAVPWTSGDWSRLPEAVARVLDDPASGRAVAAEIGAADGLISVGRGFLFSVALEAALKLKETASLLAEGYSAADLRHGPVAAIERGFPVLAFRTEGPAAADMDDLVGTLRRERGARVFVASERAGADLPLPDGMAEALAAIPAAVRAQQVALELARWRGLDPDAPKGLTKVTPTT